MQGLRVGVHPEKKLREDHRAIPVDEHAALDMRPHGTGEDDRFEVSALLGQAFDIVAMADAYDVLVDDRTLVENARDVVGRGANQLDAPLGRLAVRVSAYERGQERVVDVDDPMGKAFDER